MIYKTRMFDNIYDLKDFLNDNEIKPINIIGIYKEHKYQDQGFFDLLYVEHTESEAKNDKV